MDFLNAHPLTLPHPHAVRQSTEQSIISDIVMISSLLKGISWSQHGLELGRILSSDLPCKHIWYSPAGA